MLKKIFSSLIFIILFANSIYAQDVSISTDDAMQYIGKTKTVCGTISETKLTGKAFFINLDGLYPNQKFSNVIFKSSFDLFNLKSFEVGNRLCTIGVIKNYQNKPEIILNSPSQVK